MNYWLMKSEPDEVSVDDALAAPKSTVPWTPYPDPTQFEKKSKYYDPKSSRETPRWMLVDVQVTKKIPLLSLAQLRERPDLAEMVVLKKGNRLSIMPVEPRHWKAIAGK